MSTLGKVISALIVAIVGLMILGFVVAALRWLLMVALVVAVIVAVIAAAGSRRKI